MRPRKLLKAAEEWAVDAFLPMFPLQLVLFPGEKLKLHIFEPRYQEMVNECLYEQGTFGIPAYLEGRISEFGTEASLLNVFRTYENGEMDILAEGERIFHLDRFVRAVPNKLYSGGEVTFLPNEISLDPEESVEEIADEFRRFHDLLGTGYEREDFDKCDLSFHIAHEVGLSLHQKVHLLSLTKESERLSYILGHLRRAIPMLEAAEETRKRIQGNGHFHRLPTLEF